MKQFEELKEFFAANKGTGTLSTANAKGQVSSAVYATPHFLPDGQLAFIMRDRRTWANIQENPHACYLFLQHGHQGKRLYLTKTGDETNSERLFALRRRDYGEKETGEDLHLVIFRLDEVRPLIGG